MEETGTRGAKQQKHDYEITPDGRMRVNLSSLLKKDKVRAFYRSITPAVAEAGRVPGKKK
ncbi:MAG: hypothetical protein ACJ75H_10765 [Thermoanaerobaculia bacterium]